MCWLTMTAPGVATDERVPAGRHTHDAFGVQVSTCIPRTAGNSAFRDPTRPLRLPTASFAKQYGHDQATYMNVFVTMKKRGSAVSGLPG
jgi:hypothetical protein